MNNQLNTVNIFDPGEVAKQIKITDSVERCLNDAINETQTRLDKLLEKKRKLRSVKTSIINFHEVLKVL
mgnify:CR=1 FL=1